MKILKPRKRAIQRDGYKSHYDFIVDGRNTFTATPEIAVAYPNHIHLAGWQGAQMYQVYLSFEEVRRAAALLPISTTNQESK